MTTNNKYPVKNYVLNTLDGVFASTGQAMVGVNVLMLFISQYIDNKTLIGLLVTANILLMQCGQIFLSGRVQRMPFLKALVVKLCIAERAFWILIGIAVIGLAERHIGLFLIIFYLMYASVGLATSFLYFTWSNYIIRITHPSVRGRFLGTRSAIIGVFSMLGALIYGLIVNRWELPYNYGILFIAAGSIQILAIPFVHATKEPASEDIVNASESKRGVTPAAVYNTLKKDKTFAGYLLAMALIGGFGKMAFSFQVVYAKEKLFIAENNNSLAMFFMLACQCLGALICGVVGDKYGFRKLFVGAITLLLPTLFITFWMTGFPLFYISMGLVGLSQGISSICVTNILVGLSKGVKNMPIYSGIQNFALGPVYALNYIVSGFLYEKFGYGLICILSAVSLCFGIYFAYRSLFRRNDTKEPQYG